MSLANVSLNSLRLRLTPVDASAAKQLAESLIANNAKLGDPSSDFAAEMARSEPYLSSAFFARFTGKDPDMQAMTFLDVLAEVSAMRDHRDSLSELGEEQQLRMQMVMDRLAKAMSMLANLSKKASETASQIISNMK